MLIDHHQKIYVDPKPCGANANFTNFIKFLRIDFVREISLISEIRIKNFLGQLLDHSQNDGRACGPVSCSWLRGGGDYGDYGGYGGDAKFCGYRRGRR